MRIILVLVGMFWSDFDVNRIATINKLKEEAQAAYLSENYPVAIEKYRLLTDSLKVTDDKVQLNLSNAYFNANDSANAQSNYKKLLNSSDRGIRSLAYQQLGVMADQRSQLPAALDMFKESLKANPQNEEARFNYELVKKKLENQPQQDQENQEQEDQENEEKENEEKEDQEQDQNQEQEKEQDPNEDQKDQENQQQESEQEKEESDQDQESEQEKQNSDQQEQQGEPKEQDTRPEETKESNEEQQQPASTAERLKEMNISEEKAKMILDAMRNAEVQYIQQNQKKAKEKTDANKPDW